MKYMVSGITERERSYKLEVFLWALSLSHFLSTSQINNYIYTIVISMFPQLHFEQVSKFLFLNGKELFACIISKIWISSVDCTNVQFLILLLYYSYARRQHWVRQGEGWTGPPYTFMCNFLEAYNYFKMKDFFFQSESLEKWTFLYIANSKQYNLLIVQK